MWRVEALYIRPAPDSSSDWDEGSADLGQATSGFLVSENDRAIVKRVA
jgi:hypothetical protein